jgi:hypothetical protein
MMAVAAGVLLAERIVSDGRETASQLQDQAAAKDRA